MKQLLLSCKPSFNEIPQVMFGFMGDSKQTKPNRLSDSVQGKVCWRHSILNLPPNRN